MTKCDAHAHHTPNGPHCGYYPTHVWTWEQDDPEVLCRACAYAYIN
jgi:hypothetical protein